MCAGLLGLNQTLGQTASVHLPILQSLPVSHRRTTLRVTLQSFTTTYWFHFNSTFLLRGGTKKKKSHFSHTNTFCCRLSPRYCCNAVFDNLLNRLQSTTCLLKCEGEKPKSLVTPSSPSPSHFGSSRSVTHFSVFSPELGCSITQHAGGIQGSTG